MRRLPSCATIYLVKGKEQRLIGDGNVVCKPKLGTASLSSFGYERGLAAMSNGLATIAQKAWLLPHLWPSLEAPTGVEEAREEGWFG